MTMQHRNARTARQPAGRGMQAHHATTTAAQAHARTVTPSHARPCTLTPPQASAATTARADGTSTMHARGCRRPPTSARTGSDRTSAQRCAVTPAPTSAMHLADHGTSTMHGTMPMQLAAESFATSNAETFASFNAETSSHRRGSQSLTSFNAETSQLRSASDVRPRAPADKGVRQLFAADSERRAQASHRFRATFSGWIE